MERPVVASEITGTVDVVRRDTKEQLFALDDAAGAVTRAARFLNEPEFASEIAERGRMYVNQAFSVAETRRGLRKAYAVAVEMSS
jgi:glycosyltransferase involved in cell wall biosynthesis